MSINFTDNVFNFQEYEEFLDTYIKENFSEPQSDEEIRTLETRIDGLFTQFLENTTIDPPEQIKISKLIRKILRYEPGRQLIERLIKANTQLSIKYTDSVNSPKYQDSTKEVLLPLNIDSYIVTEIDGKRRFEKYKKFVNLAHELIHALHHAEDPFATHMNHYETMFLIDSSFHNQEEQGTISGVRKNAQGGYSFDPICENLLLRVAHLNIRINHGGMSRPQGADLSTLNVMDAIRSGARDEVLSLLERDPTQMDRECIYEGKKCSLLSLIALHKANDAVDYMIRNGADIHAKDELGGPFHAAIRGGNSYAIQQFLAAGVKPQAGCCWLLDLLSTFRCRPNQNIPEDTLLPILDAIPVGDSILNENQDETSPLRYACCLGYEKVVQKLIELEADVNAIDPVDGNTPFISFLLNQLRKKEEWDDDVEPFSVSPVSLRIINRLLQTGKIDLNATNNEGKTILSILIELGLEPNPNHKGSEPCLEFVHKQARPAYPISFEDWMINFQ